MVSSRSEKKQTHLLMGTKQSTLIQKSLGIFTLNFIIFILKRNFLRIAFFFLQLK